jgi:hypothetical protein
VSTGLFATRTLSSQGIGARAHKRQRDAQHRIHVSDGFAERLSVHGDVETAAREIGLSAKYGHALLRRIRVRLGWQAQ